MINRTTEILGEAHEFKTKALATRSGHLLVLVCVNCSAVVKVLTDGTKTFLANLLSQAQFLVVKPMDEKLLSRSSYQI